MHLTFIYPSFGERTKTRQMEPLTIATLAGLTPRTATLVFFDDRIEPIDYSLVTDAAVITVQTFTAQRAYLIADRWRANGTPVIMGGFHPTALPDEALKHADCVVTGQAEDVWNNVLEDLAGGRLQRLYRGGDEPDLSTVMPLREIFNHKSYYPVAMVEFGRGCKWKCSFCSVSIFFGARKRHRPVNQVIADIKNSGRKYVTFVDDNLTADPQRAKELFRALIPLKIRWFSQVDVRFAHDEELLALAASSGCLGVLIGFESLNPESIEQFGKSAMNKPDAYRDAMRTLHRYTIKTCASFMLGGDGDDPSSFSDVFSFAVSEAATLCLFNAVTAFPGTKLYSDLEAQQRLVYPEWWLQKGFRWGDVTFHPAHMDQLFLHRKCRDLRRAFYRPSSIVRRLFGKANRSTPFLFLLINILNGIEVRAKQGLRLGNGK